MPEITLGIDVGGTKTAYGLFDRNKQLIQKFKTTTDSSLGNEEFFDGIIDNIVKILGDNGIGIGDLRGIGIGMPSFVLFEEGKIVKTSNLTRINNFFAKEYLAKGLGGNVRIIIDNDSHTGALAEHRHGAGRGFKHMIYCPVSTGISSGIIINNELFRGSYGWSGESGHMIVTPGKGIECGCGNRGCFMSYCSGSMIVKHIQNKINNGEKTVILELAGSVENINTAHISKALEINDEMAEWAISQMSEYMGIWLYNLYVTLNINCFIFGGGLLNMGDVLFKRVQAVFDSYNNNEMQVYFKTAELKEDFGIVGAAELLF